ncbi:hypothetical protein [Streptomyces sp. NPDC054849]
MPIRVPGGDDGERAKRVTSAAAQSGRGAGAAVGLLLHERPSPRRRSVTRLRLTCLYGGVFMLAGTALLAVVSLLAVQAVSRGNEPVVELRPEASAGLTPAGCAEPGPGLEPRSAERGPSSCVTGQRQQPQDSLMPSTLLAVVALGFLSIVAGYVMAGCALSPLRRITHNARHACRQDAWVVPRT